LREDLDVVVGASPLVLAVLLYVGDALLARRIDVRDAADRYANLEN
jgi:hypothetical protein